jgi:prepilin-type N-terminal cleavage/methylation domain-containing protein
MKDMGRIKKQGGFTLIELSIVIAVGLLLILAGLKFGPQLFRSVKINQEASNIATLSSNISNVYQGRYAAITVANIIQLNLIPQDLLNGAAMAGNWGAITVAASNLTGGAAGTAYQLSLANIPPQVCPVLAPALAAMADELDVGTTALVKSLTVRPTPDAIALACAQNAVTAIVLRKQ